MLKVNLTLLHTNVCGGYTSTRPLGFLKPVFDAIASRCAEECPMQHNRTSAWRLPSRFVTEVPLPNTEDSDASRGVANNGADQQDPSGMDR